MAERVGVTCDHNPRSYSSHGHVNEDGLIVDKTSSTPPWRCRIVGRCSGELYREQTNTIVGSDDAPLVGELPNVIERCSSCEGDGAKSAGSDSELRRSLCRMAALQTGFLACPAA